MKSLELRLYEAAALLKWYMQALARERGGGTPVTREEYLAHRADCFTWLEQNEPK